MMTDPEPTAPSPSPSLADRAKGAMAEGGSIFAPKPKPKAKSGAQKRREARERTPRAPRASAGKGGRKDLTMGLQLLWGGVAAGVARVDPPVGRCMQVQTVYAAKRLNATIKGSDLLYAWLSPILGQRAAMELSSVFGPPLLIAVMERSPEMQPILLPVLRQMLRPVVAEVAREAAKAREVMEDLTGQEQTEADAALDEMMLAIIYGPNGPEPEAPPAPESESPGGEPEDWTHPIEAVAEPEGGEK